MRAGSSVLPLVAAVLAAAFAAGLASEVASAATLGGRLTEAPSGAPLAGRKVAITRALVVTGAPDTPIPVEAEATTDAGGYYTFTVADDVPGIDRVLVYSRDTLHFNQLYSAPGAGVETSGFTPRVADAWRPGVALVDLRQNPVGIDLALASNRSDVLLPTRDGLTRLATTVWRPSRGGRWPAVLARTPYNKEGLAPSLPDLFVANDYAAVAQDVRGRYASEGFYTPFRDENWGEHRDGYDSVEWIAAQDWSDGHVGTYGGSALGIVQYMTAGAPPPHLDASWVIMATPHAYDHMVFQGGGYRKELVDTWLHNQGADYMREEYRQHPNDDAYWDAQNLFTRLPHVATPMYHVGGWYDIFGEGTVQAFARLHSEAAPGARWNQKLRMGPWAHGTLGLNVAGQAIYPLNAIDDMAPDVLRWFDFWLKGKDTGIMDEPPVRAYLMGADGLFSPAPGNTWRTLPGWPPPSTPTRFYLHPSRRLERTPPAAGGGSDTLTYDPHAPVPTHGGPNLTLPAGPYEQSGIESRPDVITYTSAPLTAPLEVSGRLEAHLFAASSARDTDWTVKLVDVYPSSRALSVTDGVLRARHRLSTKSETLLTPGQVYEFVVDLWTTSLVFDAGHRVRIEVSSSNDTRFDPNPNTGHPFREDGETQVATNTIWHDAARPSYLVLPVVQGAVAGCATTTTVSGLRVERAAAGLRLRWDAAPADACFAEYRVFGAADPTSWARFARHPLARTAATEAEVAGAHAFYLVIAAGTDGANGPRWPTP